jgi:3'-5' exoribonuclease
VKASGMKMKINEFKDGIKANELLLVSNINRGVTNSGATYLTITLQDDSSSIDAKLWNANDEQVAGLVEGRVYDFKFDVLQYRNNLQAKIISFKKVDQSELDLNNFVVSSPISKDDLKSEIYDDIKLIKNETILELLRSIMKEYEKDFFEYPAASKNHHNFVGGLATHTLGMLRLANNLCDNYPILSRDLLLAGVVVHDIGKVEELSSPILTEYTTNGKLLGHISIMQAKIYKIACDLGIEDTEEVMLLRHMVLSHHGEYEFGSPVKPMIPEAEALTFIDNIDARMNSLTKAFDQTEDNGFTPRIFAMESRAFYKHKK